MTVNEKLNLTMLCDFYELTMGNGYFSHGYKDRICYFDVFFRKFSFTALITFSGFGNEEAALSKYTRSLNIISYPEYREPQF